MNFYIGYGCALAALVGYIVFAARRLKRDMPTERPYIDLRDLTDDPADATVDDLLERCERYIPVPYTVDPRRFANWEWQRIHRVQSQDYIDAELIRRQHRDGAR